jgi:hypothetical protein
VSRVGEGSLGFEEPTSEQTVYGGEDTSANLVKGKLAEKYPWVSDIYEPTSGFVHLSEKHIFNSLHITNREERPRYGARTANER